MDSIELTVFLVGNDQHYDVAVVRELSESVYLHFGIYDFEGNAGDIPAWAEEEGIPCIVEKITVNLVPTKGGVVLQDLVTEEFCTRRRPFPEAQSTKRLFTSLSSSIKYLIALILTESKAPREP